jgi:hypothetical protein
LNDDRYTAICCETHLLAQIIGDFVLATRNIPGQAISCLRLRDIADENPTDRETSSNNAVMRLKVEVLLVFI